MVLPRQLEFSTPDGPSRDTRSVRKSQRTPTSKRAASVEAGGEEKSKMDKKKRKINKGKLASSAINRFWNSENEIIILKGLAEYNAEREMESELEWEAFYPLVGDSITTKFSKKHIMGKIRNLRWSFFDHYEKVKKGIDSHSTTFSNAEAFKLAMSIWGKKESDCGQEMLKENEEAVNETEAEENENIKEAQNNESGEEVLKEQNEVANAEPLIGNGADAEQFNDKGADAEQFNDDGADAEQFNDNGEDAEQFNDKGADTEQFNDDGADAEQFNDNGEDAEQFNDKGADAEQFNDNGEYAEQFNDNGAVNVQHNECCKKLLVDENEVASSQTLDENGVHKTTEEVTAEKAMEVEIPRKKSHDADDGAAKQSEKEKQNAEAEFANVQDAFETLLSHDLSDHQKRLKIEKLRKVESETRRKLSDEWNAICATDWNLKIRKFKYSVFLAEVSKRH